MSDDRYHDTYIAEGVNPHEGREWQLLQSGEKPIALFALHQEKLPEAFAGKHDFLEDVVEIETKNTHRQRQNNRRGGKKLIFKIFAQKDQKQQVSELKSILHACYAPPHGRITPEYEAEIGSEN